MQCIPDPLFCSIPSHNTVLENCKPKEARPSHEVSIAKIILQARDILVNGQQLFHPSS